VRPMAECFLDLPTDERADILNTRALDLGLRADILEKDVWVCWVLQHLFEMPARKRMAFKGGTSLSMVYHVVDRFSEDIDISVDCRDLLPDIEETQATASMTRRKKAGERLNSLIGDHTRDVVVPFLRQVADDQSGTAACTVSRGDDGDAVTVGFPSALRSPGAYLLPAVLVEFGGRNLTEPSEEHEVRPYLAPTLPTLEFPVARPMVLRAERTFWEKATLAHEKCHRPDFVMGAERQSRHWYDLAMLADHPLGRAALMDRDLLRRVVEHKKAFFPSGHAAYDDCLAGGFRLVPDTRAIPVLRSDYEAMRAGGMFYGPAPAFDKILERIRQLEREINRSAGAPSPRPS
jgi:hypothetical protein